MSNRSEDVKCICGTYCLNYNGSILCPKCDREEISKIGKELYKHMLAKIEEKNKYE